MKSTNIRKIDDGYIEVNFISDKNKRGRFTYNLVGINSGISSCIYDEDEDEDIYTSIHEWIDKNINIEIKVKYKGKVIK